MKPNQEKAIALHADASSSPERGWLRSTREALGLSRAVVAERLGVTRASVQDFEEAEARGAITLASLRRVAAALDCDVVVRLKRKAASLGGAPNATGTRDSRRRRAPLAAPSTQPSPTSLVLEYLEPGTGAG